MSAKRRGKSGSTRGRAAAPAVEPRRRTSLAMVIVVGAMAVFPLVAARLHYAAGVDEYGPAPLVWAAMVIVVAFAAALVDGIRAGRLSLPRTWLVAPAALMVAAAVVSALRAPDGFAAFIATVRIGVGVLFFLTVLLVADSRENVRWLLAALVAGALAAAAYSTLNRVINPPEQLFQYFQQYRMDILAERGIAPGSPEEELYKIRMLNDFLGTFSHPNVLAAYVGLGVLVTIGLVAPHARRLRPGSPFTFVSAAILALFAAVAVYVVGATHGRAAAAGLVIALYFMIVMATVSSRKLKAVLLAAPVVAGAALVGLLAVTNTAPGALASLRFRVDYWTATAKLIRSHPWFGVGPDNFGNFYLSVRLPTAPEQIKDPHNFFVWAWAELGIGGLIAAVGLAALALREALRPASPMGEGRPAEAHVWRPLALVAVVMGVMAAAFRVDGGSGPLADGLSLYLILFNLGIIAVTFVSGVGLGLNDPPERHPTEARWTRAAIVAGLVLMLLQMLVSTDYSEWPSELAVYLLLGLLAATGEGAGRWVVPLDGRRARMATASAAVVSVVLFGDRVVRPVVTAVEVARSAQGHDRTTMTYRDGAEAARQVCPAWPRPLQMLAESDWFLMLRARGEESRLRDLAKSLPADDPRRTNALAGADHQAAQARAHLLAARERLEKLIRLTPTDVQPRLSVIQVDVALADDFGRTEYRERAVATWREVLRLAPMNIRFHADFATLLSRWGYAAEAAVEARRAMELSEIMPDEIHKLSAERVASLREIAARGE